MPWVRLVIAFAVCCLGSTSLGVSPGAAAPITRLYTFSASGFPAGAPTDPVTGSVTVTFDPLVSNANVPVDAIVLTIGTHTYTPAEVGADYNAGADRLLVGGVVNGINAVFSNTDDFFFRLTQASTLTPGLEFFFYSTAASGIFDTSTGSVTVTDLTPAPGCPEDSDKVLTRAVDPEGNDTGLIAGLPTHLTLQAAVDQALDGEVIGVFGRSTEHVVISAAKRLTITQCTVATITGPGAAPVVDVTSSEPITLIGLDTVGGTIGWRVGTDGHDLKGVRATGASQVGILVVGHDNSVSYNAVRQSAVGIRVEGSGNDLRGGTVEQNTGDGVQLGPTATANVFRTATVQTNGGQGIWVAGSGNTVRDNRVRGNTLNGLLVTGSQNSLRSNLAQGNTQDGLAIPGTSNTLQDNKANTNGGDGFDIRGTGNMLRGNASNQGVAGGRDENAGAEFNLGAAAINQGGNRADTIAVPKTTAPVKCPTFPAAGLCE